MEPNRKAIVESYISEMHPTMVDRAQTTRFNVFLLHCKVLLPILTESHPFGFAIRHVPPHNDMELLLHLRNFVHKLCARLEKYQKRGIVVEDAPKRVDFLFVAFPWWTCLIQKTFSKRERESDSLCRNLHLR